MTASVTIHHKAFSDPRIALLAKLLGVDTDSAGFKMARLWSVMTSLQTDTPSADHIRACLIDVEGDTKIVQSGLAERLEDGTIRVRGRVDDTTGKDRLEWYADLQERNSKGGKARAATAPRDTKGRMVRSGSLQPSQPPPAPDPVLPEEDLSPARAREGSAGEGESESADAPPLPPYQPLRDVSRSAELPLTGDLESTLDHVQQCKGIGARIWQRLEKVRAEMAEELGVSLRPLHPFDAGTRALAARIREAQLAKLTGERIEADLNHVVDVFVAEAKHTRSAQWLHGGMFEEKSFRRALGMSLDDVPSAARKPTDPRFTGRATPQPNDERHRFKTL